MKRILITGSRFWGDVHTIRRAILEHIGDLDPREVTIVHGNAAGADSLAAYVAECFVANEEAHPADWRTRDKAAGPIRNQKMVDLGADVCLAFPEEGSRGTWDCVKRAKEAGIPVHVYGKGQ